MTRRPPIGSRPSTDPAAQRWVKRGEGTASADVAASCTVFSARLTVDITPELRGRIKVAAFQRGLTVANLLRGLLEREFGQGSDAT